MAAKCDVLQLTPLHEINQTVYTVFDENLSLGDLLYGPQVTRKSILLYDPAKSLIRILISRPSWLLCCSEWNTTQSSIINIVGLYGTITPVILSNSFLYTLYIGENCSFCFVYDSTDRRRRMHYYNKIGLFIKYTA